MKNKERRIAPRIPIKLDVNFLLDGDYLISLSRDISPDGMYLSTDNPVDIGESVEISFKIDNLDLKINALVAWINDSGPIQDQGMGIRFTGMDSAQRDALLQVVNKIAILDEQSLNSST